MFENFGEKERVRIIDVNPKLCCVVGGRKIVIILGGEVDHKNIEPVFAAFSNGNRRHDLDQIICQPIRDKGGPSSVITFSAPAQPDLDTLLRRGERISLRLFIRDPTTGHMSDDSVEFSYESHSSVLHLGGVCVYCSKILD